MTDLGSAYLRVIPDTSGLNARMAGYFRSSDWGKLGKTAGLALGAGIAAGGAVKALYEVGQAFDGAYDKIRVGTGATGKQLGKLERDFKNVVKAVPADFDTAASAITGLNQRLELTGRPLQKLAKQMTELSRITETDVETNIQSVTRAFGDWEVKTKAQSEQLDRFFRASQESGASVADLAEQVVQFGAPLRQVGFSLDEATAMFAAFEEAGVNTQTMMPGLKFALRSFMEAGKDPQQTLQKTFEGITKGTIEAQEAFEIFGGRATPDMIEAIQQGRFELDDLTEAITKSGDTIRGAGRETMDFSEHWLKFKNNVLLELEPVATRVFNEIGDGMKRVTQIMTDKDLTRDEQLSKIADLGADALKDLIDKAADIGPKVVGAFFKAFASAWWDAGILGKLFTTAAFVRLIGGKGVLAKIGVKLGAWIAAPMMASLAAESVAAAGGAGLAAKFAGLGKTLGRLTGVGFAVAIIAAVADKGVRDKITQIVTGTPVDVPGSEELAQRLRDSGFGKTAIPEENKVLFRTELGNLLFNVETQKVIDAQGAKLQRLIGKNIDEVESAFTHGVGKVPSVWEQDFAEAMTGLNKKLGSSVVNVDRDLGKFRDAFGLTERKTGGDLKKIANSADDYMSRTRRAMDRESGKGADAVTGNVDRMVDAVGKGLQTLGKNTNNALQAFGAKKMVGFSIAGVGDSISGALKRQRGGIIPGFGVGDKTPVMAEPGEGFINSKAVQALGGKPAIDAINKMWPRFATGGLVQALGPYSIPPIQYDPNHAGGNSHLHLSMSSVAAAQALAKRLASMGWMASEAPWAGGVTVQHSDPGHYSGSAFDANTAQDETQAQVAAVARLLSGGSFGGAVAQKLKRMLLEGPDGPLKRMGQGSLDKSWKAAQAFVNSKMPKVTGGVSTMSGSGEVESMFARVAKKLSTSKIATLALGMAGYAESGMRDLAGGDASSQGALQLLASTASGLGVSPHDEAAIASLFLQRGFFGHGGANSLAGQGLPAHMVAQMVQGSAFSSGSNYLAQSGPAKAWMARYGLQRGGVIPQFHDGGMFRSKRPGGEGLAVLKDREVVTPAGQRPVVHVYVTANGSVDIDDVYAAIDGETAEIAEFTLREGGRNLSRSRQLTGRAGR